MEVVGGVLTLLQEQQLFSIDLGILVRHSAVAVTDGDEGEAHLVEIAHAIVGDIPAQASLADFVILMALVLPLLGSKMAEGGQVAVVLFTGCFQLFQSLVDFGTLHKKLSFLVVCIHYTAF
jgi:hypothetical protein